MIVQTENLFHRYGSRLALDGLSFGVAPGQIFALLGPNGSGKSTLFRILSTLLPPQAGRAKVAGHDVATAPQAVRREIGVVFQAPTADRKLTVWENLAAQAHFYGLHGSALAARCGELLDLFGLAGRRDDLAGALSGGLQRRLEIARAMLHHPPLLLLDEASTGLDPAARRDLWQTLTQLNRAHGVTLLFTTHLMEEADAASEILLLHNGRAVKRGTPAELKAAIGGDVVLLQPAAGEPLAPRIEEKFHLAVHPAGASLRVDVASGHRFLAEAMEAFPGAIESATVHKPTLEDVFLKETGAALDV
jgi:ABC-2 type transport system ATP-binding protein